MTVDYKTIQIVNEKELVDKTDGIAKTYEATGNKFRLVHDGKKAIAVVEGDDHNMTSSVYTIEEFDTEKELLNRDNTLKLDIYGIEDNDETINILGTSIVYHK